jgi:aminodeoxyfutalosine deaminase
MILRARWILPGNGPAIENGYLEVHADAVTDVGPFSRHVPRGHDVHDLGHVIVTPGFVNPHTHLNLTHLAAALPPQPFWSWVDQLVSRAGGTPTGDQLAASLAAGARQSLQHGVTTVGDTVAPPTTAATALATYAQQPLRTVALLEYLPLRREDPSTVAEFQNLVDLLRPLKGPRTHLGLSAHAPYTVPPQDVQAVSQLAAALDLPWQLHFAETPEEIAFLGGDPSGIAPFIRAAQAEANFPDRAFTPGEWLEHWTRDGRPGALIHGNYLDEPAIEAVRAAGHTVVYCPLAHRYFGHSPHPWRELRAAGLSVAIGTDSAASGATLSVLDELRLLHRLAPDFPTPELLKMGTLAAAAALGLAENVGSLAPGKAADFCAYVCPQRTRAPLDFLLSSDDQPVAVWVGGERVVGADEPPYGV